MTSSDQTDPAVLPEDDRVVAAAIAQVLDMEMPEACIAGVALNARLLAGHWALLREARG